MESIKKLIKAGSDVKAVDNKGKTVLMYACFSDICNIEEIKYMIKLGADIHAVDNKGKTVLMYALKYCKITKSGYEIVRYFMNKIDVEAKDSKGRYALMHFINNDRSSKNEMRKKKLLEKLIRLSQNVIKDKDNNGKTAYQYYKESKYDLTGSETLKILKGRVKISNPKSARNI